MAQIVRVENQARIMTLESLASRFEENIDNYTVINHVINSIRKQARALRERGLF
jgi:hypothetical protein